MKTFFINKIYKIKPYTFCSYTSTNRVLQTEFHLYLQTSLALEYVDDFITSGAIHAYVPAALILVVLYISRASPKSDIFIVLFHISSVPSIGSLIKTKKKHKSECSNKS